MTYIAKSLDTYAKLKMLSQDSRYDLACSCATGKDEHRKRSIDDKWIYPVAMGNGRSTFLFKTLLSNHCLNDCRYCPLRLNSDIRRCSLSPEELARAFFSYYRRGKVSGLFLSSGVVKGADNTMEYINRTALLLRRQRFSGYIHLKIIPGASEASIRQSLSLASAVSLNIEAPAEECFRTLSTSKNYLKDIVSKIELISRLIKNSAYRRKIKHTTQFVVGASSESDREIVSCSWRLYKGLELNRVYFSAYQRGAGAFDLPGESSKHSNKDLLMREHRLYQTDWLIRKYGFKFEEIPFESDGSLSLTVDPKQSWADKHPEFFPVDINKDDKSRLIRVPGIGQVMVERILAFRKQGVKIKTLQNLGQRKRLYKKSEKYLILG
ncbi:MAG: helix-hairpin-helix domain-containing protein [Candidatus Omnitrophica bacterium]|nr:helix-hairpin-helix domain-containing protein [Candidatus Omnitrophota bacterium]